MSAARFNNSATISIVSRARPATLTRLRQVISCAPRAVKRYCYMSDTVPTQYFIQGITKSGRKFRPSDWSERLCGVMSGFGPKQKGPNAYMQYSIYVRPTIIDDLKVVILDSRLRDIEPMAFDFVLNFAKDNDLVVTEACELPPHHGVQVAQRRGPQ
jgi:hypothetical protein